MEGTISQLGFSNYLINKKDPAISFFRHSYENYANYGRDTRKIPFKTTADFGKKATCRLDELARYGDLITNITLQFELPDLTGITTTTGKSIGYCNGVGNALVSTIEFDIAGNRIDVQPGEWLDVWNQLTLKPGLLNTDNSNYMGAYGRLVKKFKPHDYNSFKGGYVYTPLSFWFCNYNINNNRAFILPLASLNNCTLEVILDIRKFVDLITVQDDDGSYPIGNFSILNAYLLVDFITLETTERLSLLKEPRQFYLINQLQYQSYNIPPNTTSTTIYLRDFKYPISELFWILRRNDSDDYFNYSNTLDSIQSDPIVSTRITFDGNDRIEKLDSDFFSTLEPLQFHSNCPDSFIHCYSFALHPEDITKPSGICNFSDIQEPLIHLEIKPNLPETTLFIFALNYNVLQINDSGKAWLLHNLSKNTPGKFPTTRMPDPNTC